MSNFCTIEFTISRWLQVILSILNEIESGLIEFDGGVLEIEERYDYFDPLFTHLEGARSKFSN